MLVFRKIILKFKKIFIWRCARCGKHFKHSEPLVKGLNSGHKWHYSCFPEKGVKGINIE